MIAGVCIVICLLCLLITAGCTSTGTLQNSDAGPENVPITVTDSLGNTVTFPHPVQRIICQNGLAAEVLIDIGSGDRIVGVTDTAVKEQYLMNQIPQAKSIGEIRNPDLEQILALHPDVFIAYGDSGSIPGNIDKILAANITVLYVKVYDIRDIARETRMLGEITGNEENAERFIQFTEHYQSLMEDRTRNTSGSESPRVYLEQIMDYMVTHQGSSGDYMLNLLHAHNIAGDITTPYAIVSPEWVIEQDPDIIIKQVPRGQNISAVRMDVTNRLGFSNIHAVENGRVYALSSSMVSGPRQIIGILYIAKAIYPERFADVDPDDVLAEYAREFMPGSDKAGAFDPPLPVTEPEVINTTVRGG